MMNIRTIKEVPTMEIQDKTSTGNNNPKPEDIRASVRIKYGQLALKVNSSGCGCSSDSSCCTGGDLDAQGVSEILGYSLKDLKGLPEGANMGLGCGNPQDFADLKPGEKVLDLGSGGGIDCFLASKKVGPEGSVIGVDITLEMVEKSQRLTVEAGVENVEFRQGTIEDLPVASDTIDVVISNCVINLSPEKSKVFQEVFRVLKPGGRLRISDVVASGELPESLKNDLGSLSACIGGAVSADEIRTLLETAGFQDISILPKDSSRSFIKNWIPGTQAEDYVVSAWIMAQKPITQ